MKLRPSTGEHQELRRAELKHDGPDHGTDTASTTAPTSAPTSELKSTAPSARPPSPRRVIGYPSSTVAADVASPGMPNRTE